MKYIQEYLKMIDDEPFAMCQEQKKFSEFVRHIFSTEDLYIDEDKAEKYLSYQKYFDFNLFPWEKCLLVLLLCTYNAEDNLPRFDTSFILVGRG